MTSIYDAFGFEALERCMRENHLEKWADTLPAQVANGLSHQRFGDLKDWLEALNSMPETSDPEYSFGEAFTVIDKHLSTTEKQTLREALEKLIPWRKGPYSLCGTHIDTEWRSDMKWDRLKHHIKSLENRLVLDVGCGNGYHMWRMLEHQPKVIIGVDPSPRFVVQFEMVKRLAGKHLPVHLIPTALEAVPRPLQAFDTLFSMGVIYHRRSPIEHLRELKDCLTIGGELILESLVVDGDAETALVPEERYAKMRNVWMIPSVKMMIEWARSEGFENIQLIDESYTTTQEQRRTDWMRFESLADFLDPNDFEKTIEGYPAPKRAIILATKAR